MVGFANNRIYKIISKQNRDRNVLNELNEFLIDEKDTVKADLDGLLLHYLAETAQQNEEMIYSLSNAGIDVNAQDSKGNTALHLAYMRGYTETGFDFIEALLKVGSDLTIGNNVNKTASYYMEKIEQLTIMYKSYQPGIWAAVKESNVLAIQRLLRTMVKCNPRKGNLDLFEYAGSQNKDEKILNLLKSAQLQSDLAHSLYSMDLRRVQSIEKFDLNSSADFSYVFSWYKPVYRNLPKFLLEIAFDTKCVDLIRALLERKCDVNKLNSKTGDPFYFSAFEADYKEIKVDLLRTSNLRVKNYNGQNILFHIVKLYMIEPRETLVDDFYKIVKHSPTLLSNRDGNQLTLVEYLLLDDNFDRAEVFLHKISSLMIELVNERNYRVLQDMVYHSYGLVLLHTPIYGLENTVRFEQLLAEPNLIEMCLFRSYHTFRNAVTSGDLKTVREFVEDAKKSVIAKIKDPFGRSCLHLAVLYGRTFVVKYLLQHEKSLVKCVDSLNRTALHYAYALKDFKMVEILNANKIDKSIRDCKYLRADEYIQDEVKQDESFGVKTFQRDQLAYTSESNCSFLKCFIYKDLVEAIQSHDIDRLKSVVNTCGVSLRDLPFRQWAAYTNAAVLVGGRKYQSLLDLAVETKNFLAFAYLLEALYNSTSTKNKSDGVVDDFNLYLSRLRERADENDMYEVIDIMDNFEEDKEILAITRQENADFNRVFLESLALSKNAATNTTNKKSIDSSGSNTQQLKEKMNLHEDVKTSHSKMNHSGDLNYFDHSKLGSKLCTIL